MFEAELIGKLPELERSEDHLTSCFFGALKYLPADKSLFLFLGQSFNYRHKITLDRYVENQGFRLLDFEKVRYEFWPRSGKYGEPDLVIIMEGSRYSFLIPIEVKYYSHKHGEDEKDQIVKYYEALDSSENMATFNQETIRNFKGMLLAFVYLTQYEAEYEIEESIQILEKRGCCEAQFKIFHLTWQDIWQKINSILLITTDRLEKEIYTDIKRLMKTKNLMPFSNFSGLPNGLTIDILLKTPIFFDWQSGKARIFKGFPELPDGLSKTLLLTVPAFFKIENNGPTFFYGFLGTPKGLYLQFGKYIYFGGKKMSDKNPVEIENLGRSISLAFGYIQEIFRETAQLMRKLDIFMGKEWEPTFGNRTTRDVTSHIDDPEYWLPEASFRIFDSRNEPSIKKGITIAYWNKNVDEPILIAGSLKYDLDSRTKKPKKQHHWDLWDAWFERDFKNHKADGTIYEIEYDNEGDYIEDARVFAIPLVGVRSETDIKKTYDKLITL